MQFTKLEAAIQSFADDFLATSYSFMTRGGHVKDLQKHAEVTVRFKNRASNLGLNTRQAHELNDFMDIFVNLYVEQLSELIQESLKIGSHVESNLAVHTFGLKSAFGEDKASRIVAIFKKLLTQQKSMVLATSNKYLLKNINFTAPLFLVSEPFKFKSGVDKAHMLLDYINSFDKKLIALGKNLNSDSLNLGHIIAIGHISAILATRASEILSSPEERSLLQTLILFIQNNIDKLFEDISEVSFEEIITQANSLFGKDMTIQIIDAVSKAFTRVLSLADKIEDSQADATAVKILPSDDLDLVKIYSNNTSKAVVFSPQSGEPPIAKNQAEKPERAQKNKKPSRS